MVDGATALAGGVAALRPPANAPGAPGDAGPQAGRGDGRFARLLAGFAFRLQAAEDARAVEGDAGPPPEAEPGDPEREGAEPALAAPPDLADPEAARSFSVGADPVPPSPAGIGAATAAERAVLAVLASPLGPGAVEHGRRGHPQPATPPAEAGGAGASSHGTGLAADPAPGAGRLPEPSPRPGQVGAARSTQAERLWAAREPGARLQADEAGPLGHSLFPPPLQPPPATGTVVPVPPTAGSVKKAMPDSGPAGQAQASETSGPARPAQAAGTSQPPGAAPSPALARPAHPPEGLRAEGSAPAGEDGDEGGRHRPPPATTAAGHHAAMARPGAAPAPRIDPDRALASGRPSDAGPVRTRDASARMDLGASPEAGGRADPDPGPGATPGPLASLAASADPRRLAPALVRAVAAAAPREPGAETRLAPPELGDLRLLARAGPRGLELVIEAARPGTRALLLRHAGELQAELRAQGIPGATVAVVEPTSPERGAAPAPVLAAEAVPRPAAPRAPGAEGTAASPLGARGDPAAEPGWSGAQAQAAEASALRALRRGTAARTGEGLRSDGAAPAASPKGGPEAGGPGRSAWTSEGAEARIAPGMEGRVEAAAEVRRDPEAERRPEAGREPAPRTAREERGEGAPRPDGEGARDRGRDPPPDGSRGPARPPVAGPSPDGGDPAAGRPEAPPVEFSSGEPWPSDAFPAAARAAAALPSLPPRHEAGRLDLRL